MNPTLLYFLAGIGAMSVLATVLLLVFAWIAQGSPDVNGDPEKDARERNP